MFEPSEETKQAEKIYEAREAAQKKAGSVSSNSAKNASNPRVYLDIAIGDIPAGRVTIEVRPTKC